MTRNQNADYARIAITSALATGDAEAGLDISSRAKLADQQATDGTPGVVSAPGQLGSSVSDSAAIRAAMEALGFVWLDEPARDEHTLKTQYVRLQMPAGWELRRGSDSRQQYLHDERGVRRVSLYDVGQYWDPYCATTLLHLGYDITTRLVYGDETAKDILWDVLTAEEREMVRESLRDHVAKGDEHPDIYSETAAKAAAWLRTFAETAGA